MAGKAGKVGNMVFLKNRAGKAGKGQPFQWCLAGEAGFLFLTQISLSIPFTTDMGNKFFVFTYNHYVFMTIIKSFNLFLLQI